MINSSVPYRSGLMVTGSPSTIENKLKTRFGAEPVTTAAAASLFSAPLVQYLLTSAAVVGGGGLLMTGHYARKLYQMATGREEMTWKNLKIPKVRLEEANPNHPYPKDVQYIEKSFQTPDSQVTEIYRNKA